MEKKNFFKSYGLVILGLCVALGIFLMTVGGKSDEHDGAKDSETDFEGRDPAEYAKLVETQVREICSGISGVGEVNVVVTLSGGYRAVYATNSQISQSGNKNEIVLTGSGTDERALIVGYEYPEIGGIGIVCQGKCTPQLKARIISLISSAFGIGANKIEVIGS